MTKTESTDWATTFGYDAIGRSVRVDYQDGSFETTTWNPDSTVAMRTTRDGLTLTYTYDAANRPLSVVPSGAVAATLEPLDAGNETSWDALSRPTAQRRGDAGLTVAYPSYDLGSRPAEERVGDREALGWAWAIYDQAMETRLPIGVGRSAGSFTGYQRQFNTLNQLTGIGALGGEPQSVQLGATWSVGGSGRLWGMTTKGTLGTAVRYGYLGGAGAQPPAGNSSDTRWKLGTMTWGSMPAHAVRNNLPPTDFPSDRPPLDYRYLKVCVPVPSPASRTNPGPTRTNRRDLTGVLGASAPALAFGYILPPGMFSWPISQPPVCPQP